MKRAGIILVVTLFFFALLASAITPTPTGKILVEATPYSKIYYNPATGEYTGIFFQIPIEGERLYPPVELSLVENETHITYVTDYGNYTFSRETPWVLYYTGRNETVKALNVTWWVKPERTLLVVPYLNYLKYSGSTYEVSVYVKYMATKTVATLTQTWDFSDTPPKISVRLKKTPEWDANNLGTFQIVWFVGTGWRSEAWIETPIHRGKVGSGETAIGKTTFCIFMPHENATIRSWLIIDWGDEGIASVTKGCISMSNQFQVEGVAVEFAKNDPEIDPTIQQYIEASGDDGYVYGRNTSDYSAAHSQAYSANDGASYFTVGQYYYEGVGGGYHIYRAFLKFNTTSIPSSYVITSASLYLYGESASTETNFYVRLQKWTGDTPITTDDYTQYDGINYDDGNFHTSNFTTSGYNEIVISNFSLITKAGYTKICVRSSRDISETAPTNFECVDFYSYEQGEGYRPYLNITYSPPNNPPNAPTLNSLSEDSRHDPGESVTFTWTFNDPDSGDTQSAYRFQLDDNSDFSSPIIDTGKTSSSSTSTTQTLPSTIGKYYWRVKTWDSQDAEGPWSSGRGIIVDRVDITLSVADDRINVGDTASISATGTYAYDGTTWSGTYTLNDTTTKSTVGKYAYTVSSITDNNYGLTAFTSNTVEVIFDKITITLSVTDNRIDVGSTADWSYTATYQYDGADATSYVSVTLNDTATKNTVGKYGYTTSSISDSQYGITVFDSNSFSVIFDRVNINSFTVADDRINVGSTAQFSVSGVYEYDNAAWSGTYTLNDTATKNAVGKYGYRIASITDNNYGLTAFTQTAPDVSVIFDKLSITLSTPDDRIDVGSTATINADIVRLYDNSISGATIALNDTMTKSTVGKYGYTVSSVSGDEYGITAFESNSISIIFDRVDVTLTVSDSRIDVGSTMSWSFTATYAYDGANATPHLTVNLNDTQTKNVVGKYGYKVQSITESQYGLSSFTTNEVYCIFDALKVDSYSVNYSTGILYVHMKYAYDNVSVESGTIEFAGVQASTNSSGWAAFNLTSMGDFGWGLEAYGIQDGLYGITSILENQTIPVMKATRIIGGDLEPSSATYQNDELTLSYNYTEGSYTLKVSGPKPTYILNVSYDLTQDYGDYLTLTHDGNCTITIGYPNWGDFYIQSLDLGYMTSISWEGQKLYITIDGPSGSGTLKVYCGSRGRPSTTDGLTGESYDATSKVFTGTYTLESPTTIMLDWTHPTGSSPSPPSTTLIIDPAYLGEVHPGETVLRSLPIDWRGTASILVAKIDFMTHPEWFSVSLPKMLMKNATGPAELPITISVQKDAQPGEYTIPIVVHAQTLSGQTLTCNTEISITVKKRPPTGIPAIPDLMTWTLLIGIVAIPIALAYRRS